MSYSYGTGKYHDELLSNLAAGIGDADYGPPIARVYGRAKVTPRVVYMASGSGAKDVWAPGTILKDGYLGTSDIGAFNSYSAPVVMELCQEGATIVGVFLDKEQSSPETQVTEMTSATGFTVSHAADYNRDLGVTDSNGRGLTQVNSAPWVGTYYSPTPGTYQFAAGQGTVRVKYGYVRWSGDQALQAIRRLSGATVVNGGHWSFANAGATGSPTWVPNGQCSIQPFPYQVVQGPGANTFAYVCDGAHQASHDSTAGSEYSALLTTYSTPTPWAFLNGTNAEGMGFTGTLHIRFQRLALTEDMHIPAIAYLVDGIGGRNCSPVTALRDLLVNVIGLTCPVITNVGPDGLAASSFERYCANMPQFVINRAIDSREDAFQLLADILDATNAELFYTQGAIKVVPLADTAFGTFVPADLAGSINLMDEGTQDLLTVTITGEKDVFSAAVVTFPDSVKNGEQGQATYSDDAYANLHGGRRIAPAVDNSWISTSAHAHLVAQLLTRRSTRTRRKFSFSVVAKKWACLEAGDVVSVSDAIRLNNQLCRISLVQEQDDGSFAIEAWEWAQGNCHPVIVTPQVHEGVRPLLNVQPATDAAFQASLVAGCSKDAGTTAVAAQSAANTASQTASSAGQAAQQAQQAAAAAAAQANGAQQTASAAGIAAQQAYDGLAGRATTTLDNVAAGSVTSKLVAIGDFGNLCGNPSGESQPWSDNWVAADGWVGATPLSAPDPAYMHNVPNTRVIRWDGRDCYFDRWFDVTPGEWFYARCMCYNPTVGPARVGLEFLQNDTVNPLNWLGLSIPVENGSWHEYTGTFQAPATAYKARVWIANQGYPAASAGTTYMREISVRRMNGGKLVVDGDIKARHLDIEDINATGTLTVQAANVKGTLTANQINAVNVSCGMGRYTVGKQITRAVLSSITSPIAVGTSSQGTGRWVAMDPTGTYILCSAISSGYATLFTAFGTQINITSGGWAQNYGECIYRGDVGYFAVCSGSGHIGTISPINGTYSEVSTYNSLAMAVSPSSGCVVAGAGQVGDYRYWTNGSTGSMGTGNLPAAAFWQSVQALYDSSSVFRGWLFAGQDSNNRAVVVWVDSVGGTGYNLSNNLPNNGNGLVTGARTSTANASCSGIACGCVDGVMFVICAGKVWTATVGGFPANSPWTDRGYPQRTEGGNLGVVPARIKCTQGTAMMLPAPTSDNAYFTLDGVNWTTVNITGGCPGGVRALGVTGKLTGASAQYFVLRGGGSAVATPIAVVASGIANETLD